MFKSDFQKSLNKAASLAVVPVVAASGVFIEKMSSGSISEATPAAMGMLAIATGSELLFDYLLPVLDRNEALVQTEHMVLEPMFNSLAYAVYDTSMQTGLSISESRPHFVRAAVTGGVSSVGGIYAKSIADPLLRQ